MGRLSNPQGIADRYASGMASASQAYKDGVASVTESPTAKAARALPKALRNYQAAIDSGKTANALNRITLSMWQASCSNKGASRLASGAQAAKTKVAAYFQRVGPAMEQLRSQIDAMPSDSAEDMEARALAWMRGMKAIAGNNG